MSTSKKIDFQANKANYCLFCLTFLSFFKFFKIFTINLQKTNTTDKQLKTQK